MLDPYKIVDDLGPKSKLLQAFGTEMGRLKEENEQLKIEKEQDKKSFAQSVLDLTTVVEALIQGGIQE
ncbi:hypothetical protein [Marinisporobacter balticus]|uniref:Uncharacterized protein n=1 Tax=Marinisporobacter balticus TaxID=2018667 RepID=A0A4R2K7Y7_9FIRM|nr:hypothetical protein [Marinisporobacter balticus]TCO69491.1 hypothetical protein EV214_13115 [Marinisporobacter balticus]